MWWDVRKMDAPTENMYLDPTKRQDPGSVHGATSLEYEPTIVSLRHVDQEICL